MFVTIFGFSRLPMSMNEIVSFPGGRKIALPASSHNTFSSLPDTRICAPAFIGSARNTAPASIAILECLFRIASSFYSGWAYVAPHPRPETLALFVIPSPLTSASTNRSSERWPFIDQRTDRLTRWRNPNQLECPLLTQADIACAPPNVRFQG